MSEYSNPTLARLAQRFAALEAQYGHRNLADAAAAVSFAAEPGTTLLFFADDPQRVPETWDLCVILPEVVKTLAPAPRVGLLAPAAARELAGRYGLTLWPAIVALRDGGYLGAVEGLKDWGVYLARLPELLAAPACRPPGIGIPVQAAAGCHH